MPSREPEEAESTQGPGARYWPDPPSWKDSAILITPSCQFVPLGRYCSDPTVVGFDSESDLILIPTVVGRVEAWRGGPCPRSHNPEKTGTGLKPRLALIHCSFLASHIPAGSQAS